MFTSQSTQSQVAKALADCRRAFWSVAIFSGAANLLLLAGPFYMLQVYDRVLASRSVPTLIALSIFLVGAYVFQGVMDFIRTRIVVRSAALLDHHLGTTVHAAVVRLATIGRNSGDAGVPVRDLDQIRTFLTGTGPIAIVDLPWVPVFLSICYLIHPWLGLTATMGAIVLFSLTLLTERASRSPAKILAQEAGTRSALIEADRRNSESIIAMGMTGSLAARWARANNRYIAASSRASDVVSSFGTTSKVFRLMLQSIMLGLGAYIVILHELTAGAMIAASIMMSRGLAPIESAIANWRSFISARQSVRRLSEVLARVPTTIEVTTLPKPMHRLEVESVTVAAPGSATPILRDLRFQLGAGEVLGIIGPNGAGKSSLLRVLVGIWRPARGAVRIDGAALDQWDPEELGKHIGVVTQQVDLFDGTVAENIARMSPEPDARAVFHAARAAGADDMILRLPNGYDTRIGDAGAILSAGQRQRIALARALYGDPFLIALDEPHANLDNSGELALNQAIETAKARGAIVILIAHRPSALSACDKVLLLANGQQQSFGPKDEIVQKVVRPAAHAPAASNLKVVGEHGSRIER